MTVYRISAFFSMLLLISACVTINVYFPTAEAAEAADQIIRGVYGKDNKPEEKGEIKPDARLQQQEMPVLISWLNRLIKPAHAAANISIQSPAITAIRASMKTRFNKIEAYYQNGSIGMTRDGHIEVRDLNAVPLPKRKSVNKLVADENSERDKLYKEIAKANGHPEWEIEIRSTFAKRWVDNAPAGWMYQDAGGGWVKK
jgi:uncharacterized protein YdbL (DUF1318 family)